jgi:hypothetical protein
MRSDAEKNRPSMAFFVEASPTGGYRVMLGGHPVPISRHDTEEEAVERMQAYWRGVAATLPSALGGRTLPSARTP